MTAEEKLSKIVDIVSGLSIKVSQASYVQQEVTENFFEKWQPMKDSEDRFCVAHDFNRYGTFSEIVAEKIYSMEKEIEALKKLVYRELSDEVSKTTTHE